MGSYFNYHATAKRLIVEGHLSGYEILEEYHGIHPCLLLHFDEHKPMPIREYRWDEYFPMIGTPESDFRRPSSTLR